MNIRISFVLLVVLASTTTASAQKAVKFTPPQGVKFRTATIMSEGTRMAAEIFSPASAKGDAKLPTIVMCHGWGGVAEHMRPDAVKFAKAGFLVVTFDYRGWGNSDGRVILTSKIPAKKAGGAFKAEVKEIREVVDPIDQTTDLLNAIHWAYGEKQCDKKNIGLWGSSFSGGHVVYAAARDHRVKALVSQVPSLDGRWAVGSSVIRNVTYKQGSARTRGRLPYPKPGAKVIGNLKGAPILEKMMHYAPVNDADKAPNCAMLFIIAEKEELFKNEQHGILAHKRAKGTKKLVVVPGITHYGIYREKRTEAQKLAIDWFTTHLKK